MSKRQVRLNNIADIRKNFSKVLRQKVNIVLNSGAVFFVKVLEMKDKQMIVENMRLKKSTIELSEINEIILVIK